MLEVCKKLSNSDGCYGKLTHTVITDAAMGSTRGSEDLAGVAVLQLDYLIVNLHILDARGRPLPGQDVPIGRFCNKVR